MGIDLYAVKMVRPYTMSWWGWRPMVDYLDEHCGLTDDTEWRHNSGACISEEEAVRLGTIIFAHLQEGKLKEEEERWKREVEEDSEEPCDICNATGFTKRFYVFKRRCHACDGDKWVQSWESSYRFREEYMAMLADFLVSSGGFRIC